MRIHGLRKSCFAYLPNLKFKKLGDVAECPKCAKSYLATMKSGLYPKWKLIKG
jgi:hypothetical protein